MVKHKIVAKSALVKEQLLDKKSKGAKWVEIHLTVDTLNTPSNEIIAMFKETGVKPLTVHAPFTGGYNIDDIINDKHYTNIWKLFKLADDLGKHYKKKMIVVMHMMQSLEYFNNIGKLLSMEILLKGLLTNFKHVTISVENLQVLCIDTKGDFYTCNNYYSQSIEFVRYMNERIEGERLGLTLDTCHAIHNERVTDMLPQIKPRIYVKDYFKEYAGLVNVIHLANCIELGLGNDQHAQPFRTKEDIELLKALVEYIKEIDYELYIVLEVNEDNYLDSLNWQFSNKQLKKLLKEEVN